MDARRREAKGVGAAAVHVSRRVDVSARAEKELGDFHDIFRRPLAKSFYAVRADVVEQRRMMFARRACADEPRTCAQQPLECRDVADDDGVDRRFELRDRRTRVLHRVGKCGELIPALEVMFARDDCAGISLRIVRREAAPPRRLHRTLAKHVAVAREQRVERRDVPVDDRLFRARPDP